LNIFSNEVVCLMAG